MAITMRLVLGDQLNLQHSWFSEVDQEVVYVLMEMRQETDYVKHHRQKVLAFFGAMRRFAEQLREQGHQVEYLTLDDPRNSQSLTDNLTFLRQEHSCDLVSYQLPDEYRLDVQLSTWAQRQEFTVTAVDSEHFLTDRTTLAEMFKGKKTYLMESFYRKMRKQYDILMEGTEPVTGRWNYDAENRKKLPKAFSIPPALFFQHNLIALDSLLDEQGVETLGQGEAQSFPWPLTRDEALQTLDHFIEYLLPLFGTYQDAMHSDETYLYHSRLSFALNVKILSPLEVVKRVEEAWLQDPERVSLAQVEGYIRQIIGWREYMRGVYWAHMPEYADRNRLGHKRSLPQWYWTGETKMNCLRHSITQSLEHAYAHHIQRLMVTGNFALLAGVHPDEVDAWYLGIYIDAIEWVEITNTRGMSQFADGGLVGTKPYVSSANYIHKMSNYCTSCHYDKKEKVGENACPFNSLYWHFYDRHREQLERNPRIGMMYRTWDKMDPTTKEQILGQAEHHLAQLDSL
ncbi:MAG: cryptochrome/photolyase family protein [Bacteroidota bacterium]